jgi:hypothetical protein
MLGDGIVTGGATTTGAGGGGAVWGISWAMAGIAKAATAAAINSFMRLS